MMYSRYYKPLGAILLIILVQSFFPVIYLGQGINFVPDFLLIYMTYLSIIHKRYVLILYGFSLGFLQDITTQVNLLGLFAFSKSITGYLLGYYTDFKQIWKSSVKILFLLTIYFIHYLLCSYLMYDRLITPLSFIIFSSFIQSSILVIVLLIVNRFILIDNKIIN